MLRRRGANLRSQKELNVFSHFCPFCPFLAKSCHPNMIEYFPCRCCSNLFDPRQLACPGAWEANEVWFGGCGFNSRGVARARRPLLDYLCATYFPCVFHVLGPIPIMWIKAGHVPIHPARYRGAARCKKLGTKRMCRIWGSSLCFVSAFVAHSASVAPCGLDL